MSMNLPNFSFERKIWRKGFELVAGCDEVGRGCFAGPIVAGCVVFPTFKDLAFKGIKINDSKKLTPLYRQKAEKWIKKNALAWGIGEVPVSTINRVGMSKATRMAFRKAILNTNRRLGKRVQFILLDAFYVPYIRGVRKPRNRGILGSRLKRFVGDIEGNQLAIVDGDEKSLSIASASIIAKVYRDRVMTRLGRNPKYKMYAWERNKGYGTIEHINAILKYGVSRYHRKQFVETFLKKLADQKDAKLKRVN